MSLRIETADGRLWVEILTTVGFSVSTFVKKRILNLWGMLEESEVVFRLDALALSVIATATWLAGWLGGWLGGCMSQPVLYQND